MKNLFVILSMFFLCNYSTAYAKTKWYEGKITLTDNQQLTGELCYNPVLDLVCFRNDASIKSYSAIKVKKFEFFDDEYELIRKFLSVDYTGQRYISKIFFEVILEGEVKLLYRDNNDSFPLDYSPANEYPFSTIAKHIARHSYYAFYENKFIDLRNFKSEVYPMISRRFEGELSKFVSENNLSAKRVDDQIVILDYYNHLVDPNYTFAAIESITEEN